MSHTANPRHPDNPPSDPPAEPTGPVIKDSLANESIEQGGAFGDNKNPEVLSVKGGSSTLANTDTTNAVKLDAASSGADREGDGTTKYPDAGSRETYGGTTSDQGFRGGPSGRGSANTAPNYAADTTAESDLKPKGENLVEGKGIPLNHVTKVGDVDSPKDPSRLAQQKFAKDNADASSGITRDYGNDSGKGEGAGYENLNNSESA